MLNQHLEKNILIALWFTSTALTSEVSCAFALGVRVSNHSNRDDKLDLVR